MPATTVNSIPESLQRKLDIVAEADELPAVRGWEWKEADWLVE